MKLFISIAVVALITLASVPSAMAQSVPPETLRKYGMYDTDMPSASFHAERRAAFRAKMTDSSIAIFIAAPEMRRSNDVNYLYHQDPDFYYLTGCTEPATAVLISKLPISVDGGPPVNEVFFTAPRVPTQETWTGKKLGPEGVREVLGFTNVHSIDTMGLIVKPLIAMSKKLYYDPKYQRVYDPVVGAPIFGKDAAELALTKEIPMLKMVSPRGLIGGLRGVKTPEEQALIKKAVDISVMAHKEIMKEVRPGWHEYELQALGEYIFTKNGAEYTGYPSIVGSGENSVTLHYESNRRQTKPGDFIEMDMGAEYHGYSADVTRSFPVTGKFTPEQAAIYDLVKEAQDSGIAAAQADSSFRAPHKVAMRVISAGLVRLGITKDTGEFRLYFMHGTSHHLGLDVHDASDGGPLKPGNIITVEPGVYIKEGSDCDKKWWNIGCRIEDDVLITKDGPVNLSAGAPRSRADVEKWMKH